MSARALALLLLAAGALPGAVTTYHTDSFVSLNPAHWTANGPVTVAGGVSVASSTPGSLISTLAVPGGNTGYEVATRLRFTQTGGSLATFVRATPDARLGTGAAGSFLAVEVTPEVTPTTCVAHLWLWKRVAGVLSNFGYWQVGCNPDRASLDLRTLIQPGSILVQVSGAFLHVADDPALPSGQPGVGGHSMPAGTAVEGVRLVTLDTVAPWPVLSTQVALSAYPTRVDLQWTGGADDAGGIGLYGYDVYRNGVSIGRTLRPAFTDLTVQPGQTHTYQVYAFDHHLRYAAPATLSATTPPAGAVEPRQVGVRPLSAQWGAAGESVDLRSGNLNYTVPLFRAQGRGRLGVTFALSYNSQMWRKDAGGVWLLGRDVGYGRGWRLMAGSLTPVHTGYWGLSHYVFTDSTGAEYRLDQNAGEVWTGRDGFRGAFDANSRKLWFLDGTFWLMAAEAGGTEQDAGTLYPTLLQDSNGNQVRLAYQTGLNAPYANSSARLTAVEDPRAPQFGTTYQLTYAAPQGNPLPRLQAVTNPIGTGERYTLTYQAVAALTSPFGDGAVFGPAQALASLTQVDAQQTHLSRTQGFTYSGAGELTGVALPLGGRLAWVYGQTTLQGNRTVREVRQRVLYPEATGNGTCHVIWYDPADANQLTHRVATVTDAALATATGCPADPTQRVDTLAGSNATAQKSYAFRRVAGQADVGLVERFEERAMPSFQALSRQDHAYATDASGTVVLASTVTTLDVGLASQRIRRVEQTVDAYGNVTQVREFGYGPTTQPVRTTATTYVTDPAYTSRYLRSLPTGTWVTEGAASVQVSATGYDGYTTLPGQTATCQPLCLQPRPGIRQHDTGGHGQALGHRGNPTWVWRIGQPTAVLAYDVAGNVTGAQQGSRTTLSEYSVARNFTVPSQSVPNGNANLATSATYTPFLGLSQATGPNGTGVQVGYDAMARPTSSTGPHGAAGWASYPSLRQTVTGTGTRWTRTTVDGLGRVVLTETGTGAVADANRVSVAETEHAPCACSPLGKVKRASLPHAPGTSARWTTYVYDALGRTVEVRHPSTNGGASPSGVTRTLYEGNETRVTDPAGKRRRLHLDALGRLAQVTEPNPVAGGAGENGVVATTYEYNLHGQLTRATMPRGSPVVTQVRTWAYDLNTLTLTSATQPESGTTTYTYDAENRPVSRTDARGMRLTWDRDGYGRVTVQKAWRPGVAGNGEPPLVELTAERVTYAYDQGEVAPGVAAQNAWGRVVSVTKGTLTGAGVFTETYSYTAGGLVTRKRLAIARQGGAGPLTVAAEVTQTYDAEGRVLTQTVPTRTGGATRTWTHNARGLPEGLTELDPGYASFPQTLASGTTYGAAGEVTSLLGESYQYNERLQLTLQGTLEYRHSATENNGAITHRKEHATGEEVSYTYDALSRLARAETTASTPTALRWGLSYTYDGFGNKTGQTVTQGAGPHLSLSVDAWSNRVTSGWTSYDAAGNQVSGPGIYYGAQYDAEGRMVSVNRERYAYDAAGRRVWRERRDDNNAVTGEAVWLYSPQGERVAELSIAMSHDRTEMYLWAERRWAYFAGKQVGLYADRLGTGRARRLAPYGEELGTATVNDEDKFATYHRDQGTGLDYAQQRYYTSAWGRFMTPDPYQASGGPENPQSWNRYSYVEGDPVNYNDPEGLARCLVELVGLPAIYLPCASNTGPTGGGGGSDGNPSIGLRRADQTPAERRREAGYNAAQRITLRQRAKLSTALGRLSEECKSKFDGLGIGTRLGTAAGELDFYEATGPTALLLYGDVVGAEIREGEDLTIGSIAADRRRESPGERAFILGGPTNVSVAGTLITRNVVLHSSFAGLASGDQDVVLIHESLHWALQGNDFMLANALGLGPFSSPADASTAISNWLRDTCLK